MTMLLINFQCCPREECASGVGEAYELFRNVRRSLVFPKQTHRMIVVKGTIYRQDQGTIAAAQSLYWLLVNPFKIEKFAVKSYISLRILLFRNNIVS